jgi:hypothetical protein
MRNPNLTSKTTQKWIFEEFLDFLNFVLCSSKYVLFLGIIASHEKKTIAFRGALMTALMCWCVGVLTIVLMIVLICWCVDVLMCWCVDVLMCCVLMCWCAVRDSVYVLMFSCVDRVLMCDVCRCDVLMCWYVDIGVLMRGCALPETGGRIKWERETGIGHTKAPRLEHLKKHRKVRWVTISGYGGKFSVFACALHSYNNLQSAATHSPGEQAGSCVRTEIQAMSFRSTHSRKHTNTLTLTQSPNKWFSAKFSCKDHRVWVPQTHTHTPGPFETEDRPLLEHLSKLNIARKCFNEFKKSTKHEQSLLVIVLKKFQKLRSWSSCIFGKVNGSCSWEKWWPNETLSEFHFQHCFRCRESP